MLKTKPLTQVQKDAMRKFNHAVPEAILGHASGEYRQEDGVIVTAANKSGTLAALAKAGKIEVLKDGRGSFDLIRLAERTARFARVASCVPELHGARVGPWTVVHVDGAGHHVSRSHMTTEQTIVALTADGFEVTVYEEETLDARRARIAAGRPS